MIEVNHQDAHTVLDIKNLKTYFFLDSGTVRAVDGVDIALDRNTTLGLVGESGCGKSVTAMSVMRLIQSPPGRIVEGEILFHHNGGVDIATLDPRGSEIRNIRGGEIAMVFQEPMTSLNPLYTVGKRRWSGHWRCYTRCR
jgi:oligopeptide transport system ATP-binding protein